MANDSGKSEEVVELNLSRRAKIRLSRVSEASGFQSFRFENHQNKQVLLVHGYLFDAFRRKLSLFVHNAEKLGPEYVRFKGNNRLKIERQTTKSGESCIHVIDLESRGESDSLSVPTEYAAAFFEGLFSSRLFHPSGCLERVISYHRMLQLAFPNVSESLNGEMGFRQNFLCMDIKDPQFLKKGPQEGEGVFVDSSKPQNKKTDTGKITNLKDFKSRLGAKKKNVNQVNYDEVFGGGHDTAQKSDKPENEKKPDRVAADILDLGLASSRVKSGVDFPIRFKPDETDLQDLRDCVLAKGGKWDFLLGFEIVDCWYKDRYKKPKCFRFPLYFMPVKVSDFGSEIEVTPQDGQWAFLNFLGFAQMVAKFSKKATPVAALEQVFQRLLHARFDFDGQAARPYLMRKLPVSERCFSEQRRVIFGQEDSGPIDGIFDSLQISHVTFDLERTLFFAKSIEGSAKDEALSKDLQKIFSSSVNSQEEYFNSLLGRVFTPEKVDPNKPAKPPLPSKGIASKGKAKSSSVFNPFDVSANSYRLFQEIEKKKVLLVEGPPGTGKTYSMLNLMVHCVCKGQSVLVVSDKQSAIDALYEKN